MRHWIARLRMTSPLATPLTAERLFGHVCWGMAHREGPEAVAEFLSRMRGQTPPLVIGSPMPAGFAPMPAVLRTGQVAVTPRGRHETTWERYRRRGVMPRTALLEAARNLGDVETVLAALDAAGWHSPVLSRRQVRVRSAANRTNGAPAGRNDWLAVETWDPRDRQHVEVLIVSDCDGGQIEQWLRGGLEDGFGRSANVGYGQIELTAVEPLESWPEVDGANAAVTLGPCVPRREDPSGGTWQVRTVWGKLGGDFSAQTVAAEKRPVMTLEAGAVLTASGDGQPAEGAQRGDFVGRLVSGVHPERPEVVHYGLAPVLWAKA